MPGLNIFSMEALRKNPAVLPVVGCIGLGIAMAAAYVARLALMSPDVTWNQRKNNEPWQRYANKEYKFYQYEPFDVKNYKHPRPPF